MGIRINKVIGYGLQNLRTKRLEPKNKHSVIIPNDRRWDYDLHQQKWDNSRETSLSKFLEWCKDNEKMLVERAAAEKLLDEQHCKSDHWLMVSGIEDRLEKKDISWTAPYSCVEWDSEYGLKNVMNFTPAEHYHDWRRHDDAIDYYEETLRCRSKKIAHTGIYPYDSTLRQFREPNSDIKKKLEKYRKEVYDFSKSGRANCMSGGNYNQLIGKWDKKIAPIVKDEDVLRHLVNDWRPIVPIGVLALIEYLGSFPDPYGQHGIVNSLRPMVYVYWA